VHRNVTVLNESGGSVANPEGCVDTVEACYINSVSYLSNCKKRLTFEQVARVTLLDQCGVVECHVRSFRDNDDTCIILVHGENFVLDSCGLAVELGGGNIGYLLRAWLHVDQQRRGDESHPRLLTKGTL
jgi:hypothetical protein